MSSTLYPVDQGIKSELLKTLQKQPRLLLRFFFSRARAKLVRNNGRSGGNKLS